MLETCQLGTHGAERILQLNMFIPVLFGITVLDTLDTESAQLDCLKCSRMNIKMVGPLGRWAVGLCSHFFFCRLFLAFFLAIRASMAFKRKFATTINSMAKSELGAKNDTDLMYDSILRHRSSFLIQSNRE